MQPERIQDLEVLLGHHFREKNFLLNALSHSSIKTERRPSNERLEFLGDSVLGLIVSDALYRRFPEDDEGTLTRIKSQAVSRATLQRVAVAMGLDRFILVGKGVAKREIPASLLGNLFEAIVGAIYLDAGLAASRKFVMRHLDIVVEEIVEDRAERNYKSMLQHYCQREKGAVPTYRILREAGPAHGRTFDVAVLLNGKEYGRARGESKKEAEQGSARAAMIHFRAIDERPNAPTRGAGTLLRVGPDGAASKRKKTSGRRSGKAAPGEEQSASPAHTPAAKATSSRRGSRGGRGRRKKAAGKPAAAPSEPVEKKPEPVEKQKKKAKRSKRGGRKVAARRAAAQAKTDAPAPKPPEPKAKPPAAPPKQDAGAPAPERKKKRRRSRRRKKT